MASSSNSSVSVTTHPDYGLMQPSLQAIRDCMCGSPVIKSKTTTYLPWPSDVDNSSPEQQARYSRYLKGAEFESFPDDTRRELIGKMRISDTVIEVPDSLDYLINNIDGDGLAADSAIEYSVNNILQTKWHILVAEYKGAPTDANGMSRAEQKELNTRSVVKQYTRENVVNWNFSRVNGVMQLSYIQLLERTQKFNQSTGDSEEVENYLTLALDDEGYYYQAKSTDTQVITEESRNYPEVNKKKLRMLPVIPVADETLSGYDFPIALGYLWGICDLTLARYIVSGDYKEVQRSIPPTIFSSGWKNTSVELFKKANNGRNYVATGAGAVNNMPDGVTTEILSASPEMDDFHWYFETNEKTIRSKGGAANTQSVAMTATEADISANKQNALLNGIADNVEDGYKKAIYWCGVFEGTYALTQESFEAAMEEIIVDMPRDFATPKLSTEEVGKVLEQYTLALITREQALKLLHEGGWGIGEDLEATIAELEEQPPLIGVNNESPTE